MLAWLLVTLLFLTSATILFAGFVPLSPSAPRAQYVPLILGLDAFLLLAYVLNAAGWYTWAAGMTVACTCLGSWGSLLVDPLVRHGDFVPLSYAVLSVILCSILLPPRVTAGVAVIQFSGYVLLARLHPAAAAFDWVSLLILLFFTAAVSIVSSIISQDNLTEIDRQTGRLEVSRKELRELSVRDHLTGLFNRRYLEEALGREIRRSLRSHYTIGVILFDVDQLKPVNDRFGHGAGDVLLQAIGGLSMDFIRGGDIACRYGGDEFVLVLPEASGEAAHRRAEQFAEAVRRLQLSYHNHLLGAITISVGVARYPTDGASSEELLKAADQAMYHAKQAGGGCVRAAEPVPVV
ncbi:MAG TPA: GGDEF domain-containing protein [Anaerolineales bacterium]|nr:GGDEF domain-containing protein [Anaerolineales bacterium]